MNFEKGCGRRLSNSLSVLHVGWRTSVAENDERIQVFPIWIFYLNAQTLDWVNDFECFSLAFRNYCVIREIEYVLGKHSSKLDAFALTFHYLCIRQDVARQKELTLRFILFALTFHYLCRRYEN